MQDHPAGTGEEGATRMQALIHSADRMAATAHDFFARKTKIIVLTILTYAALC